MEIIPAQLQHLPAILDIYDHARTFMAQAGNPTQWGDGYPQKALLEDCLLYTSDAADEL